MFSVPCFQLPISQFQIPSFIIPKYNVDMFQKILTWLFQLLVFLTPLFFATNTDELFEFNKMMLTYLLTIGLATVWLLRMVFERRVIFQKTALDIPLILFFVSQLISTIFSIHPHTSWLGYYSRFHGGLLSTIAYIVLYYAFVSNYKRSQLPALFFIMFSSAALVSLYGILEHFGHSPSCLIITGTFDVGCWVQDVQSRVFATFGQPNWLAAYLVTLLPLGVHLSMTVKKAPLKAFYFVTSCLLFTALIFTKSRSGLLGFGVSAGIFSISVIYLSIKTKTVPSEWKKQVTFFATFLLIAALAFGTQYTPSLSSIIQKNKNTTTTQIQENVPVNRLEQGGTDSGEIRKIVWTGAIDIWKRYPLFGSGVETFAYSYYKDRPQAHNLVSEWDFLYNKAHNEYLNFLATTGIVGLSTYLLLQAWVSLLFIRAILFQNKDANTKLMATALLAGYAAVSVSNFFGFSTVMIGILFFLLPGFFIVWSEDHYQFETEPKKKNVNKNTVSRDGTSYIFSTIVILIALVFLAGTLRYWQADKQYAKGSAYLGIGEYSQGFALLGNAIDSNPKEALYYDTLADTYSQVAVQLHLQGEATVATELATSAVTLSNQALELNPVHLNFHKTKIRILIQLARVNPSYLNQAELTAHQAIELAPTDAKLRFTLAQLQHAQGKTTEAVKTLQQTIEMKPNYEAAYTLLAEIYISNGQPTQAVETANYILEHLNPDNTRAQEIATTSATKN